MFNVCLLLIVIRYLLLVVGSLLKVVGCCCRCALIVLCHVWFVGVCCVLCGDC